MIAENRINNGVDAARESGDAARRLPTMLAPRIAPDPINPTGMFGRVEVITPERAAKLLQEMPDQRAVRPNRVDAYCADRLSGNWRLTHQGLAIDEQGLLRDGQHRMHMVVKTGLATSFFVVYNLPPESILHVDENVPRTIRDAFKIADAGDFSCSVIATANMMEFMPGTPYGIPTRQIVLARLRKYADALDFSERMAGAPFATRGVRCLVARAFYHCRDLQSRTRLEQFAQVMRDGHAVSGRHQDDASAINFRNSLMGYKSVTTFFEVEKYRKGQSFLRAFLDRKAIAKTPGTEKDLFPLPADLD